MIIDSNDNCIVSYRFPGDDYYQPAMPLIKPARVPVAAIPALFSNALNASFASESRSSKSTPTLENSVSVESIDLRSKSERVCRGNAETAAQQQALASMAAILAGSQGSNDVVGAATGEGGLSRVDTCGEVDGAVELTTQDEYEARSLSSPLPPPSPSIGVMRGYLLSVSHADSSFVCISCAGR